MSKILIPFILLLLSSKLMILKASCVNNQKNCQICLPLNNICLKCISDNYFPDQNGECEPKCIIGKNFCDITQME